MILTILGLCALPLFVSGFFMRKGKGLMLLAGYNTMPKELREKIDKQYLSKAAGNLLLRMAIELLLLGIALEYQIPWLGIVFFMIYMIDPCLVAMNLYRKFPEARSNRKTSKIANVIAVVIGIIALLVFGLLFYIGEKEPSIDIMNDVIRVEGMYGLDIVFSDIVQVTLIEKSMEDIGVGHRDNGYGGFGRVLKGNFSSQFLGKYLLFVDAEASPTIWIEQRNKKDVYLSFADSEKTWLLYQQLSNKISPEN